MIKKILKNTGFRIFACWLGANYIRLIYYTGRWKTINGEIPQKFWSENKPFILAFWHGRLLMISHCWSSRRKINMLISHHRDGQIISRTMKHLGIDTISGSSSKGGAAALRAILKSLKEGTSVGITPDGPRGPRMRVQGSIADIAQISGIPVIPVGIAATRRKRLNSWDHFLLFHPFTRGVFLWGNPIWIDKDTPNPGQKIEDELNRLSKEADERCGQTPIEPAEW